MKILKKRPEQNKEERAIGYRREYDEEKGEVNNIKRTHTRRTVHHTTPRENNAVTPRSLTTILHYTWFSISPFTYRLVQMCRPYLAQTGVGVCIGWIQYRGSKGRVWWKGWV